MEYELVCTSPASLKEWPLISVMYRETLIVILIIYIYLYVFKIFLPYKTYTGGTVIHGGQRFANFYCTSFKTNICVDTEGAL